MHVRPSTGFTTPLTAFALALLLSACGGGEDGDSLAVAVDGGPTISTIHGNIVLTGEGSVPPGSTCPKSNDYVVIGSLGPHQLAYINATTRTDGPLFDVMWICNSEGGRVMHWQSHPMDLAPGVNKITVTMTASGSTATETVTVTRTAP